MSVYLFTALCYLLSFILICNTLCGQTLVNAEAPLDAKDPFELFKDNSITKAKKPDVKLGDASEVAVKNYNSPVLVSTKKFFFALTDVERTVQAAKQNIDILTKYTKNGDVLTAGKWTQQFAVQHEAESDNTYFVKGLLAVAAEEKVYLLLLNYTKNTDSKWEFKIAVATTNEGQDAATQIEWAESDLTAADVIDKLKEKFTEEPDTSFSFSGSTFLTEENKMVFALVVANKNKKASALMQLNDEKTQIELKTMYTDIAKDCQAYFFSWDKKFFMIFGKCSANAKKIMELSTVGEEWKDSTGAFSRQWEFLKDKKHFTTTEISGEEPVLLFTEERTKTNGKQDRDVNLWMSDGDRTTKIDVITTIKSTDKFTASILYTEKGLFALYQKCETQEPGSSTINKICFTNLKQHFKKMTKIVNAWKQINDDEIKKLYKHTDMGNNLFSADGLVGFLYGTDGKDKWIDKCLNVDATINIKEKTKVDNGLTFTGQGAGARWIVGERKDDQPYNLKYSGFTFVATVTVGNIANDKDNSILGVVLADNPKNVGLWCTTGGKWVVKKKDGGTIAQSSAVECKHDERYYVALILNNNGDMISVYINGQKLSMLKTEELKVGPSENIKHFYFGVDKGEVATTDVTIENVLLYNLPFEKKNK